MKRPGTWIALALGLLALVAGLLLLTQLERREVIAFRGLEGAARTNPLYTAQRLLETRGLETRAVAFLDDIAAPAPRDTLLTHTPPALLEAERVNRLLDWVAGGGHLLVVVDRESGFDRPEGLLERLGVTVVEQSLEPAPLTLTLPWTRTPLTVEFQGDLILVPPPDGHWTGAGRETFWRLLVRPWGAGRVTVITDAGLFDNDRLPRHDHARLLVSLVELNGPDGRVWFQYLPRVPSLWQVLWQRAWMPLLGGALALAALVAALGGRLGPRVMEAPPGRRSLLEHIRAGGRFLWQRRAGDSLLAATRRRVIRRLEHRLADWPRLEPPARVRRTAELTGLESADVHQALSGDARDEAAFTRTLRLLQRMENNL